MCVNERVFLLIISFEMIFSDCKLLYLKKCFWLKKFVLIMCRFFYLISNLCVNAEVRLMPWISNMM